MQVIPYGKQHITQEDLDAVNAVLLSDYLTTGPNIKAFEDAFSQYVGAKYAVAVANGTAALHLCALALDVNEQTKVITSPITFAASANCIRYCGGEVVFADIDPETALIDIKRVESLLASAPKGTYQGLVPVDFAGYPVNLEDFRALADEYGLWIIEDACHAPGGWIEGHAAQKQSCGNGQFADLAIFSFHPVKHIACGEGGMITTNNKTLYDRLMVLRTHGITRDPEAMQENHGGWYYEMIELGYNYRLTDFQSALGLSQLKRADAGLARRREIARRYDEAFLNTPIHALCPKPRVRHAYHLYVVEVDDRKGLYDFLRKQNIYAQVHYIPVHTLPYYQKLGWKKGDFPLAEAYYSKALSLPMYPSMTDNEQSYVIEQVLSYYGI